MKQSKNNQISISNDDILIIPGKRKLFAIDENEWKRLKGMIGKYSKNSDGLLNIAIFFTSSALTLVLTYIALDTNNKWKAYVWDALLITLTIGIMSFVGYFFQKKSEGTTKEDILEQMKAMEGDT